MDLLREYEFDALCYVDKEYDNDIVKNAVHQLISEEMKAFVPQKDLYLSHLPTYDSKLRESSIFQADLKRQKQGASSEKVDMKRYASDKPDVGLENDVQAWKKSISNAKSQYENQLNKLVNLELAEQHVDTVWLHHNKRIEDEIKVIKKNTDDVNGEIMKVNASRKRFQEDVFTELDKAGKRRDVATMKAWQIRAACNGIEKTQSGDSMNE